MLASKSFDGSTQQLMSLYIELADKIYEEFGLETSVSLQIFRQIKERYPTFSGLDTFKSMIQRLGMLRHTQFVVQNHPNFGKDFKQFANFTLKSHEQFKVQLEKLNPINYGLDGNFPFFKEGKHSTVWGFAVQKTFNLFKVL